MSDAPEQTPFETWAVLELMGHRRLAGWVTEQTIAGTAFLRIDIPATDDAPAATQWYAPGSVYAITPTTEATARRCAGVGRVAPVTEWELPQRRLTPADLLAGGDPDV